MSSCQLKPGITMIMTIILITFWALPAAAGWSKDPAVNNPVCTASLDQISPQIIGDGAGGSIIAWLEKISETEYDIYAQRLGPAGEPLWTADGVAVCTAPERQHSVQLVSDGAGGAIIIWDDERLSIWSDIYAQRVDANGTPLWTADGVPVCIDPSSTLNPRHIADGSGGAIIVWQDHRSGSESDIYAQRLSPAGVPLWTIDGKPVCNAAEDQTWPDIVSDGAGGAVIVWQDYQWLNYDIRTQRLNSSGELQWTANGVMVCVEETATQSYPHLVSDGAGGAVIAWRDRRNGGEIDFYAQRVDSTGAVQWTPDGVAVCTAVEHQSWLTLLGDGSGGATICWNDPRMGVGDDVYAQRVDAAGTMLWQVNGEVVCDAAYNQYYLQMVDDGGDGVIISWVDYRDAGNADVYAQRLDAGGSALWQANGVLVSGEANDQSGLTMLGLGRKGVVVTYTDLRNGVDSDIYAQWVDVDGQVGGFANRTVDARFGCIPDSGTVPFTTTMSTRLTNLYDNQIRRISGVINVRLANNTTITNWRAGFTNLLPHENFNSSWSQSIPAASSVIGVNNFTLKAVDVTPAPYNQPPYPSSGDVDFETCLLTAATP